MPFESGWVYKGSRIQFDNVMTDENKALLDGLLAGFDPYTNEEMRITAPCTSNIQMVSNHTEGLHQNILYLERL